jgi:restriction endonuclease S subunit
MFIDKSSWTVTKFGDVAIQQKVNVNREDTSLTKYVKGEHMSSEDIHLRSWGELQDEYLGPAFIRYFEEGDILYGSRRTYLKKVSIAPFEGITSNTTFVIKANEEKIDKRLLPFLMLSDGFTEHSIMHSKGSVNPYINWKDLAKYEFLLPPKDQQGELAELLWSLNDLCRLNNLVFEKTEAFKLAYTENFVHDYRMESKISLSKALSIPEKTKAVTIDRNKILTVRLHRKGVVRNESTHGLKLGATTYFHRKAGQFIYGKQNLHNGALGIVPEELDGFVSSSDVPALDINEKIIEPQFLITYLGRTSFYKHLEKYSAGSGSKRISEKTLRSVKIDQFSLEDQQEFLVQNNTIKKSLKSLQENISSLSDLEKSIINQIF